ncbi:MAG: YihY/virulence factor BrkB family protein [Holophagaceae bacterium]
MTTRARAWQEQTQAVRAKWTRRAEALQRLGARTWRKVEAASPRAGVAGRFAWEVLLKYRKDDCLSYAAGLSFWLMISLVPLTALLFKLLAVVVGGSKAYTAAALRLLEHLVPYFPDDVLRDLVANSRTSGGVGLSWIVLLVGSYWGIGNLDNCLAHIFGLRIKKHRQTRKAPLLRQVGLLLGGLVFLVVFMALFLGGVVRRFLPFRQSELLPYLPPLLGLLVTTFLLQHVPRIHVKFRHALLGALVSTGLWWAAKLGFGFYLAHSFTWGIMYGSLLGVMASLLFLYYSSAIFLLGAEVTAAFYRHETGTHTVPKGLRVPAELRETGP